MNDTTDTTARSNGDGVPNRTKTIYHIHFDDGRVLPTKYADVAEKYSRKGARVTALTGGI